MSLYDRSQRTAHGRRHAMMTAMMVLAIPGTDLEFQVPVDVEERPVPKPIQDRRETQAHYRTQARLMRRASFLRQQGKPPMTSDEEFAVKQAVYEELGVPL